MISYPIKYAAGHASLLLHSIELTSTQEMVLTIISRSPSTVITAKSSVF